MSLRSELSTAICLARNHWAEELEDGTAGDADDSMADAARAVFARRLREAMDHSPGVRPDRHVAVFIVDRCRSLLAECEAKEKP